MQDLQGLFYIYRIQGFHICVNVPISEKPFTLLTKFTPTQKAPIHKKQKY